MTEIVPDRITVEAARALTDEIRRDAELLWEKIALAYTERAWDVLGYASWDAYTDAEFGSMRLRLPREERQQVVCSLRSAGLSIRAIESATGVSHTTITKDLDEVYQSGTPAEPITGTDGKTYPPKPDVPKPAPEEEEEAEEELEPPRPIDTLVIELIGIVAELEEHCEAMTLPLPDWPDWCRKLRARPGWEIDPREVKHHPFTDGVYEVLEVIRVLLEQEAQELRSAEDLRAIWPTMTAAQKRRYMREMENDDGSLDHEEYDAMVATRIRSSGWVHTDER